VQSIQPPVSTNIYLLACFSSVKPTCPPASLPTEQSLRLRQHVSNTFRHQQCSSSTGNERQRGPKLFDPPLLLEVCIFIVTCCGRAGCDPGVCGRRMDSFRRPRAPPFPPNIYWYLVALQPLPAYLYPFLTGLERGLPVRRGHIYMWRVGDAGL